MARRLISREGFLCGGSSGSVTSAAFRFAKENKLTKDHRIVVVLPDNIRNYITKFVSKEWMAERNFCPLDIVKDDACIENPLKKISLDDLKLKEVKLFPETATISEVYEEF